MVGVVRGPLPPCFSKIVLSTGAAQDFLAGVGVHRDERFLAVDAP
jgi:hypothetical protein